MKIGVLQFFSWPERRVALPTVYQRALERIEIMDRTGFDAVWLAEHHFSTFSVCPSVHMMGTLAAARTKRLRIGTAVSLAALYHPLRLAEEVALLDVLSGGRVCWGAGRGFAHSEFAAFGVPPAESAERFREAVEIVLKAWTQERLSHDSAHFHFDNVEVLPKPLQHPHPPVWLAASSESAVDYAASQGFSIMMDPHSTFADIGGKRRRYAEGLAAAGFSDAGRAIVMSSGSPHSARAFSRASCGALRSVSDSIRPLASLTPRTSSALARPCSDNFAPTTRLRPRHSNESKLSSSLTVVPSPAASGTTSVRTQSAMAAAITCRRSGHRR